MNRWLALALTSSACLMPVGEGRDALTTGEGPNGADAGTPVDAGNAPVVPVHTALSDCFPAGSARRIYEGNSSIQSMRLDGPGRLALRFAEDFPWYPTKKVIDFDGTVLSNNLEVTHERAGLGAIADDGHGLTVFVGGEFAEEQNVTYVTQHWSKQFRPLSNVNWPGTDIVYNPVRDEFALFWKTEGRIAMQTRFTDGGVGSTSVVATDFLAKPAAVAWTPDRYVVLGLSTVYSVGSDGVVRDQIALSGTGRTVATDLGSRAGVTVHGFDGGSLAFTEISGTDGSMTARSHQLLDHVKESAADAVWDPVAGAWRVAFAPRLSGPISLATITPSGGLVQLTPIGCSVLADEIRTVLSGRTLFIMYWSYAGPAFTSGVLRVDL